MASVSAIIIATCPLLLTVTTLLVYMGVYGHRDDYVRLNLTYCETYNGSSIFLQPKNSWSSVSYIIVGTAASSHAAYYFGKRRNARMTSQLAVPLIFTTLINWIGPMSLFYHGLYTDFSARMDGISINLFVTLVLVLSCTRSRYYRERVMIYIIGLSFLITTLVTCLASSDANEIYFLCVASLAAVLEIGTTVLYYRDFKWFQKGCEWLVLAGGALIVATTMWILSRGETDCVPEGHVVWHVFTALACGCLYMYYAREVLY